MGRERAGRLRIDEAGRSAILQAVARVEARTAAEVVVVVRERSGLYVHADLVVGIAAGYVTLWFQLFSPWEFSLVAIQAAPAGVGVLAGLANSG